MNQYVYIVLEEVVNNLPYRLSIPNGAPFKDAHEVLVRFSQQVVDLAKADEERKMASAQVDNSPTDAVAPVDQSANS